MLVSVIGSMRSRVREDICIGLEGKSVDRSVDSSGSQRGGGVRGGILPQKNIWHYLEMYLIVRTMGEHATGRGQGCY